MFKSFVDKNEERILDLFQFLIENYGFSYAKGDLGDAVDERGEFFFYGPLKSYHIYNNHVCINILYLVQRQDFSIYITDGYRADQIYIRNGTEITSNMAYNLPLFAGKVRTSIENSGTICGHKV